MIQTTEENVHVFDQAHVYNVLNVELHEAAYGDPEIGTLNLFNTVTSEKESFTIWAGDEAFTYFYVCLPTGGDDEDEDDELDIYNLDDFDISIDLNEVLIC